MEFSVSQLVPVASRLFLGHRRGESGSGLFPVSSCQARTHKAFPRHTELPDSSPKAEVIPVPWAVQQVPPKQRFPLPRGKARVLLPGLRLLFPVSCQIWLGFLLEKGCVNRWLCKQSNQGSSFASGLFSHLDGGQGRGAQVLQSAGGAGASPACCQRSPHLLAPQV